MHERGHRPSRERILDERVTVRALPFDRDEQRARRDRAGIRLHGRRDGVRSAERPAHGRRDLGERAFDHGTVPSGRVAFPIDRSSSAATANADLAIVTSDNPRSEDPLAIIAQITPGAEQGGGRFVVEPDRRAAIRLAMEEASSGDVVVIAGKGHETYQELGDRTIPFDDRAVAADELRSIGKASRPLGTAP